MRNRVRGFTLIELLIVIVIVLLLMGLFLPAFAGFERSAKLVACARNLRAIHGVLMAYCESHEGWLPYPDHYYGYRFFGDLPEDYNDGDGKWVGLEQVKRLKQYGAKADIFFCPFDRAYGDPKATRVEPHGRRDRTWSSWENPNVARSGDSVWASVVCGYTMLFYRPYQMFRDGRYPARDRLADDNIPIVADELFLRLNCPWPNLKGGWHHGGGVQLPDGSDPGLFNDDSSCNTLFMGGQIVLKEWKTLEEETPGLMYSSRDCWWFALEP